MSQSISSWKTGLFLICEENWIHFRTFDFSSKIEKTARGTPCRFCHFCPKIYFFPQSVPNLPNRCFRSFLVEKQVYLSSARKIESILEHLIFHQKLKKRQGVPLVVFVILTPKLTFSHTGFICIATFNHTGFLTGTQFSTCICEFLCFCSCSNEIFCILV